MFIYVYYTGAMKDNEKFIRRGFLVLLPVPNDQDRLIIYGRPSLIDRQSNDDLVDEVIQVFWYLVHVAMEYPRARKVSLEWKYSVDLYVY